MLTKKKKLILIASDKQFNNYNFQNKNYISPLKDRISNYKIKTNDNNSLINREEKEKKNSNSLIDKEEINIIGNKKIITSYQQDIESGIIYKTTKEFQLKKVKQFLPKAVLERRKWNKFGVSKGLDSGPDSASTSLKCDEVFFEFVNKNNIQDDTDNLGGVNIFSSSKNKTIKCKYCGGSHWSMKCTNKDSATKDDSELPENDGKFFSKSIIKKRSSSKKNEHTIRVSNISINATEKDIRDLFSRFGHIIKMYFKQEKGFAFITFDNMNICQNVVEHVDKHPYDHLILSVEIAKNKV